MTPQEHLEELYVAEHSAVLLKLEELRRKVDDMPADDPSWGRVGTLKYLGRVLADVLEAME